MKHGAEEFLKDIFVTLSKNIVIVAISSGLPYFDPNNFSKTSKSNLSTLEASAYLSRTGKHVL